MAKIERDPGVGGYQRTCSMPREGRHKHSNWFVLSIAPSIECETVSILRMPKPRPVITHSVPVWENCDSHVTPQHYRTQKTRKCDDGNWDLVPPAPRSPSDESQECACCLLFDVCQHYCHFSISIGSFLYQHAKPPQETVLFINVLGKGLTPKGLHGRWKLHLMGSCGTLINP